MIINLFENSILINFFYNKSVFKTLIKIYNKKIKIFYNNGNNKNNKENSNDNNNSNFSNS